MRNLYATKEDVYDKLESKQRKDGLLTFFQVQNQFPGAENHIFITISAVADIGALQKNLILRHESVVIYAVIVFGFLYLQDVRGLTHV